MIDLIIEEYNKWVENPQQYVENRLYLNGYDPYFPPMQIIGNLLDEKTLETLKKEIKIKDGLAYYNSEDKIQLNTNNKLAIIGLEPMKSRPLDYNGSYQNQYRKLYANPYNNPLVDGNGKIELFRTDILFNRYIDWQLNYFNFWETHFSNQLKLSKHWHKCWNLAKGLINGNSDFVADANNNNHYENYRSEGLNWLGEKIFSIDILPMHNSKNKSTMINHGLGLFEEKISIVKPKIGLIIGKNAYQRIRTNFTNQEEEPLRLGSWEVENCIVSVGTHKMKLFATPSQGTGTYKDYYCLGSHLSDMIQNG
jgi:hypothetical protein